MKRFVLAFAGALSLAMLVSPGVALARGHGGGHHGGGFHRIGHHGGGFHHHGGRSHFGGFRHHSFGRPHFGPRFGGPAYGWHQPRAVFVGGYPRPYPVYGGPRHGFGGPGGCSVRRSVDFVPGGWRKIVTVRTCYVR